MAEARPLLTIAIPTFGRAGMLGELLEALVPQLREHPDVELLVSDNASPDETPEVVRRAQAALGRPIRCFRQTENIGSDANFLFCFEQARGRYLWICGDDDVLVPGGSDGQPGALDQLLPHLREGEFDLVYATSFPFREDWRRERAGDPLGRQFHVLRSARQFARVTNIMFTFISGMVVNKDRFLALSATEPGIVPPREFLGSNLPQLSWTLPLLRWHRQSLVLWQRPVGGRQGNAAGYALGHVFGGQLVRALERTLPDQPDLRRILENFTLRRWLPSILCDLRGAGGAAAAGLLSSTEALRASYGGNPRFWLFTWPVLRLPLRAAGLWARGGAAVSKLIYMAELPSFWRRTLAAPRPREAGGETAPHTAAAGGGS